MARTPRTRKNARAEQLRTELVPVSSLKPYGKNPRRGDVEAIRESLRVNGQYRPLVVRDKTREVLAGNHTLKAAKEEGLAEVWATFVECDAQTAKRIVLVDNRSNDVASYDLGQLADLLGELPSLEGTGYSVDHLKTMRHEVSFMAGDGKGGAPDDAPPVPEEPDTAPGDLYQLGAHRLLCGDATVTAHVERLTRTASVDLLLTDPPYCSGGFQESGKSAGSVGTTGAHKQIANDRLSTRGYVALLKGALSAVPAPYAYVFTDWRMWVHLFDVVESCGFGVRSMIVWDKGSPGMGRGWRSQHELIMWGAKTTPPFDKHAPGAGNVIAAQRTGNPLHTTQKPVELVEQLLAPAPFVRSVYDPFGGSGTTLIGCEEAGRACHVMELDPGYCDVIVARWEEHTGRKAELVDA